MRKRTKIIAGIVVLILAGGAIYNSTKKKPVNYTGAKVERGDVVQTVSATGEVEAASKVDLKFVNSEKIKEIDVKVGDTVKQGAILARLDTTKLDAQLLQAQASLAAAQANYQTLLDGSTAEQVKLAETGVNNAQISLTSAKQSLNDTNTGTQRDIANAESSLSSARVSLNNANQSLENVKASNDNSLRNAYDSAWDGVNSALATCEDALNTNNTTLGNDDAKDTLSVLNSQYLVRANASKAAALNSYNAAVSFRNSAASNQSPANVDAAIAKTQDALGKTSTTLSDTYIVLQATVSSSKLSQAELDGLKTGISTSRTGINNTISTLTAKKQAISSQAVANQTSLNNAQAAVNSATSAVQVSESNLAAVQSAASAKINSAQNAVYSREGELKQAQDNLNQVKAGPSSSKISASKAQIDQAQANVELVQNQINEFTLCAPQDGTVTAVSGEVGEIASMNEAFVSMIIPHGFQIKANIAEVDIAKLRVGEDVDITFDALGSDKEFTGKVSEIDPAETVISGVVYYKVTTLFTDDNDIIKPGMTANLDIMTAKKENVLKVPFQAVKEKEGKKYAQIVKGKDNFQETPVTIGLKGDSDYEITDGLDEGQEVVTFMGK